MSLSRRIGGVLAMLLLVVLLGACGGANASRVQTTPPPKPTATPGLGQQLLTSMAQKIKTAKTLHGIFDIEISGTAYNGSVDSELWNASPDKSRTAVLQSTLSQFSAGSVTVTDGKEIWQYDAQKKVVYEGAATSTDGNGTPTAATTPGTGRGQSEQSILTIVQAIFTHSDATLVSSTATIDGHDAYEVHVVPQGQATTVAGGVSFDYDGDIYIDKTTNLPLQANLTIQGFGHVLLELPLLVVNQPIPASTFTFVVPAGVKVLPLAQANAAGGTDTGSITLAQAQQQAGYHLLSIPSTQPGYVLGNVNALGAPGSQIFTLNYSKGSSSFTIAEGKPLANLPANSGGRQVSLRGTSGTVSTTSGSTTLAWTENGVGISISGSGLSSDQIVAIAKLLS